MKKQLKKNDIIKIIDGPFKNFYGRFSKLISERIVRIKVMMFGKKTFVNLDVLQIKKVVPKCFKCEKFINIKWEDIDLLTWEYGVPYWTCDKCLKEYRKFEKEADKISVDILEDWEKWGRECDKLMKKYGFVRTPCVRYTAKKMASLKRKLKNK